MAQARALLEEAREAEVIDALRQSIAADPGRRDARLRLGYLYEARQCWELAIKLYRYLIRAKSKSRQH